MRRLGDKLAAAVWLLGALLWASAAPAAPAAGAEVAPPPQTEVVVYRNITCFNKRKMGPRHCASWRVRVRADRFLVWSIAVTNIEITRETFDDSQVYGPGLRRLWVRALKKGLEWAKTARKRRVNMEKKILSIDKDTTAVFVSTNHGGWCAVRFGMEGWIEALPVYMYVPFEEDRYSRVSIDAFLRNLDGADRKIKKMLAEKRRKEALFH